MRHKFRAWFPATQALLVALVALAMPVAWPARAFAQDVVEPGVPSAGAPVTPPATGADAPAPPPPATPVNTEEADREARTLFEQGRVAFDEGRFRDAWDYFHRAYQLSKRPKLLYNVGQSADRLRMDREALKAFKLYLKKVPNADNRKEVEARVKALEERFAREGEPAPGHEPAGLQEEAAGEPVSFLEGGDDAFDDANASPQAGSKADTDEEVPPPRPNDGQPMRSGWYLRMAIGPGFLSDTYNGGGTVTNPDPTLQSATASMQLGVGYGVTDGVVVGGGLWINAALAPTAEGSDVDSAAFSMLGVFADWYLAPREHGWHILGGLALASLTKTDAPANTVVGNKSASGFAILAGGGYEWRVGDEWGIGAQGLLTYAPLTEDLADHSLVALSAMFSATWY